MQRSCYRYNEHGCPHQSPPPPPEQPSPLLLALACSDEALLPLGALTGLTHLSLQSCAAVHGALQRLLGMQCLPVRGTLGRGASVWGPSVHACLVVPLSAARVVSPFACLYACGWSGHAPSKV